MLHQHDQLHYRCLYNGMKCGRVISHKVLTPDREPVLTNADVMVYCRFVWEEQLFRF